MYKKILIVAFLMAFSAAAFSKDLDGGNAATYTPFSLNLHYTDQDYFQLAAAETPEAEGKEVSLAEQGVADEYEDRWITANASHKWLGLGSLALAAAAVLAPKEDDGAHHELAKGAVVLGGAAVGTGLVFHYKDLSAKNFFSNPDNWHAMLATLGVIGYAIAVDQGGEGGHAEAGMVGMVSMIAGIKITW